MVIRNTKQLATSSLRRKGLSILEVGLQAALIPNLMNGSVKKQRNILLVNKKKFDLSAYEKIFVIGGGKASSSMAFELEKRIGNRITAGLVNDVAKGENKIIKTQVARHPLPDRRGVAGVKSMLKLTETATKDDLVICLISGGGSALMPLPVEGITLKELEVTNKLLVNSGASIQEINAVRKHLSNIKGGMLAKHLYPATVLTLILSDVVGDDIQTIASGPTTPDKSTFRKAHKILKKYSLSKTIPVSVLNHIKLGMGGHQQETPKPDDPCFKKVHNFIIGNNQPSLLAMKKKAASLGFISKILSSSVTGEAATFGKRFIKKAKPGVVLIAGGETVVTVRGKGKGGRCQDMCLNVLPSLPEKTVFIACGSDGRDHTDKAGAIVDIATLKKAKKKKIDINKAIATNSSYDFFKKVGGHIDTGPTGTNVMDFYLIIKEK